MNLKLQIFDTVISTEVCYHDVAEDIFSVICKYGNSKYRPCMLRKQDTIYFGSMYNRHSFS